MGDIKLVALLILIGIVALAVKIGEERGACGCTVVALLAIIALCLMGSC